MQLRKGTARLQCHSLGVCISCASDLCFQREMLGVHMPAGVESLWGTSPSMAGCYHRNNYQKSPRQPGNNGEGGRLRVLCNGVALVGWGLLKSAGGLIGAAGASVPTVLWCQPPE